MNDTATTDTSTPTPPETPVPSAGRDGKGRFTKGNPGGPGNPFARRVAALRTALLEVVTEDDIQESARKLIEKARQGDLAAIRLLYAYVLGKPAATVDPDRLDEQEMRQWLANTVGREPCAVTQGMPIALALDIVRSTREPIEKQLRNDIGQELNAMNERDRLRQEMEAQLAADRAEHERREREKAQQRAEKRRQAREAAQQATTQDQTRQEPTAPTALPTVSKPAETEAAPERAPERPSVSKPAETGWQPEAPAEGDTGGAVLPLFPGADTKPEETVRRAASRPQETS